ncbi:MAG: hypothetical protein NTX52_12565 [Planctomycetota bacterium]|nr:hypothetical protein [Planctomycetota bacterium]
MCRGTITSRQTYHLSNGKTLARPASQIRIGTNKIGNYTHIYDNVNIEGGRPAKVGSFEAEVPDRSTIGDECWINHGATMHGTQVGDGGAVGLNACCDYINTRIGKGAILANGSATHIDYVIPDNSFAEGVPAVVKKENITEEDRLNYFGLEIDPDFLLEQHSLLTLMS